MLDKALQILAPHLCLGCSKIGSILCDSCRYDIINEPFSGCIVCRAPAVSGVCTKHQSPIDAAWVSGERDEVLGRVIDAYKFERCRSAHKDLARIVLDVLPILPQGIVVTSVPTVRAHVRERGYDHAKLIAQEIAKRRNLPYQTVLRRLTNDRQRGASRKDRFKQAERAYDVRKTDMPESVLLVDDVVTTGATLHFAARTLKQAGVRVVFAVAVAKQPLDQTRKI